MKLVSMQKPASVHTSHRKVRRCGGSGMMSLNGSLLVRAGNQQVGSAYQKLFA